MAATDILRHHHGAVERAARAGYAARGVVFVIIGYFASRAAYATGQTMSSEQSIREIFGSPFGSLLLAVLVLALLSFSLWRFVQALWDVDRHGTSAKGLGVRTGLMASCFSYLFLTIFSASLLVGSTTSGSSGSEWSDAVPPAAASAITVAIGLVMLVVAGAHIVKGVKAGFLKYMTLPSDHASWMKPFCQFGLIARGVTFLVLAFLLFTGAALRSPGDAPGLEDALDQLAAWPAGWLLLSVTGLGLLAFGGYSLIQARYRSIRPPA